jgi:hypothetical protein
MNEEKNTDRSDWRIVITERCDALYLVDTAKITGAKVHRTWFVHPSDPCSDAYLPNKPRELCSRHYTDLVYVNVARAESAEL